MATEQLQVEQGDEFDDDAVIITEHFRSTTGSEFLCQALVSAGVTHVFGGHGGAVVPLIDAIVAHPQLTWVYCRCETNCSQAASAYAKLHGTLGCCVATSGPGASHLLSGLIDADQDRVPLLCITGMKSLGKTRHSDFQDIDQSSIFRMAGLAYSETVSHIDQLLPLSRNAFTVAIASNRCAHLAIPINVQQETVVARTHFCLGTAFQSRLCISASNVQIESFAMALRHEISSSRRVLIACGYRAAVNNCGKANVGRLVERLAELMHAPILTSFDGKGTVDERHPLSYGVVGVYGNAGTSGSVDLLEHCDTVIGVCVSDYSQLITDGHGLQVRKFLQIDERLIAGDSLRFSPSAVLSCEYLEDTLGGVIKVLEGHLLRSCAQDERIRVTLSSKKAADAILLHMSVPTTNGNKSDNIHIHEPESARDVWSELRKESYLKPIGTPSTFLDGTELSTSPCIYSTEHCHPAVFFKLMGEYLDEDVVVCADIGDNSLWLASALPSKRGQRFLTVRSISLLHDLICQRRNNITHPISKSLPLAFFYFLQSEHLGIMGYAVNAGIAASLSSTSSAGNIPSRFDSNKVKKTLVVAGDGGIQMSINELATLKDHGAKNVLIVVICNSRLGRVQNEV
jgi:thiamine pyrophosphate-dependent acetolactate synthase large subunit-like protein